jgi:hypothetical protein
MPEQSPTRFTMVPARRSSEPTARKRARRILGTLFLAAGLSVAALVVALARQGGTSDRASAVPAGRDLAYTAAVNFLAGAPQNVPHATSFDPEQATIGSDGKPAAPLDYQSLSWVGFTVQHFGSQKAGFTDFELHHFLVVLPTPEPASTRTPQSRAQGSGSSTSKVPAGALTGAPSPPPSPSPADSPAAGPSPSTGPGGAGQSKGTPVAASNVLQLDVPVLLTVKGPRLAAAPSFSVWRNGVGDTAGKGDYTNYGGLTTDVSDPAKNQILEWARAYVTGDSGALLAVTGDQDPSHRYAGLSGFVLPDSPRVEILSAIKAADQRLVVRVRVPIARASLDGRSERTADVAHRFTTFADFDLLVGAPAGAQPLILAWGPAGSAAELEPYYNALGS